jgi:hypothetical protein
MSQKVKIDDVEYELDKLSDKAKQSFKALQFVTSRIYELDNMRILLRRAKKRFMEDLKKEMISSKAGFLFEED